MICIYVYVTLIALLFVAPFVWILRLRCVTFCTLLFVTLPRDFTRCCCVVVALLLFVTFCVVVVHVVTILLLIVTVDPTVRVAPPVLRCAHTFCTLVGCTVVGFAFGWFGFYVVAFPGFPLPTRLAVVWFVGLHVALVGWFTVVCLRCRTPVFTRLRCRLYVTDVVTLRCYVAVNVVVTRCVVYVALRCTLLRLRSALITRLPLLVLLFTLRYVTLYVYVVVTTRLRCLRCVCYVTIYVRYVAILLLFAFRYPLRCLLFPLLRFVDCRLLRCWLLRCAICYVCCCSAVCCCSRCCYGVV